MEKFSEKEYYRQKIIEMVGKIESVAILEYLYIFIKGKTARYINNEENE